MAKIFKFRPSIYFHRYQVEHFKPEKQPQYFWILLSNDLMLLTVKRKDWVVLGKLWLNTRP